jgi:hypothetical protein
MRQPLPDGSLMSWEDIRQEYPWSVLLLGNGLSVGVWPRFAYPSLFKKAQSLGAGVLSPEDLALFERLGTQNFEFVLGQLNSAVAVAEAIGNDSTELLARYQSVQRAAWS